MQDRILCLIFELGPKHHTVTYDTRDYRGRLQRVELHNGGHKGMGVILLMTVCAFFFVCCFLKIGFLIWSCRFVGG